MRKWIHRGVANLMRCSVLFVASASASSFALSVSDLAIVVGTEIAPHSARIAAVKGLGKSLSSEDVALLYDFLGRKAGEDKSKPGELNAVKNEVVNVLKMQQKMPTDLPDHLMEMYKDLSQDEVWRDYCIQHLGDIYTVIDDESVKGEARKALWSAVQEKQGSIPGTGLMALFNLSGKSGFEKTRIAEKALEMVRSPEYGEPAKMTALQICAKLGETEVLPEARKLVAGGAVPVRMSAIACVGILGDKSDLTLMKGLETNTDVRIRTAAQAAVKRLSAKRGQE